jgi:serine/threonine protein kinase
MLGRGGQADVVVAFDEQMKRRVAIKCVALSDLHESAAAIEEARTAAMLNHPNIVTMYDFAVTDDKAYAYLIMEHIDGLALCDIASEDLTAEIVASIVRDVGDALVFAHKNGVLHLDIKPANIIINHEGLAKVIDFGVSALSQRSGTSTATAGTVGYMPLEQLRGETVSEATDQWALAAVIYELLTDEYPYEEELAAAARLRRAPDDITLMTRLQNADEPNLIQTPDEALNETLARALLRSAMMRFGSVKELRGALLEAFGQPRVGRKQLAAIIAARTDDSIGTPDEPTVHDGSRPHPLAGCFSALALALLVVVLSLVVLR